MKRAEFKRLQYITQTQAEVEIRTKALIDELWSLRNQAEELRLEAMLLVINTQLQMPKFSFLE